MVSFDVVSLFTSIPLKESIDLTVSYIAEGNPNLILSKADLVKLFSFATSQTNFLFNGKMYDQIDGVAMVSPIAPVLANLFLGLHENILLNKYQGPSLQFYRRYADDTFCLFNNEQDALLFFDFLNSQHRSIKFTMEKESNKMFAFLDIYINNKDPCNLLTSVCRKHFTGLLTNFYSCTSYSYKIGLIRILVDKGCKINSTIAKFSDGVKKLFDIFKKNQYPEGLIVHSYLENIHSSSNSKSATDTSIIHFKLPFLKLSNFTQRKVRMLAKKYCNNLNIKLACSSFIIKNLLAVKDRVNKSLRSFVVYKFTCSGSNSAYIGETSRHLSTRVRGHLFTDKNSHIFKHLQNLTPCKTLCSESCFKVLDSASTYHNLEMKEALYIM